jgi:hypothetical protein
MRRVPTLPVSPLTYPAITRMHTSANAIDERGQKSGVLKSVVGIGDVDLSPARVGLYPFLALPTSL